MRLSLKTLNWEVYYQSINCSAEPPTFYTDSLVCARPKTTNYANFRVTTERGGLIRVACQFTQASFKTYGVDSGAQVAEAQPTYLLEGSTSEVSMLQHRMWSASRQNSGKCCGSFSTGRSTTSLGRTSFTKAMARQRRRLHSMQGTTSISP